MACECLTWCRVPDAEANTYGGRFPPSDHHPDCPEYRAERFLSLSVDGEGPRCVCTPAEAEDMQRDADEPYHVEEFMLAPDQVEKLKEFDGF